MRADLEKKIFNHLKTPITAGIAAIADKINIQLPSANSNDLSPSAEDSEAEMMQARHAWLRLEKIEEFKAKIAPDLKSYQKELTSWMGAFNDSAEIAPTFTNASTAKWKWYSSLPAININNGYIKPHLAGSEKRLSGDFIRFSKFKAFNIDYDHETANYITRTLDGGYQTFSKNVGDGINAPSRYKKTLIPHSLYRKNPDAWFVNAELRHPTIEGAIKHFEDSFSQEIFKERLRTPWRLSKISGAFAIAGLLLAAQIDNDKAKDQTQNIPEPYQVIEP